MRSISGFCPLPSSPKDSPLLNINWLWNRLELV